MYQHFATFALLSPVLAAWDYKDQGKTWRDNAGSGDYVDCAKGQQSPIDLTMKMKQVKADNDFTFGDYKTWGTCNRFFGHETVKFSANYVSGAAPADQPTTSKFSSKYFESIGDTSAFAAA